MNGRGSRAKRDTGRDGGAFVALPHAVLDCPAYAGLSHPARALLLEVARQCHGDDNGRLLLSRPILANRGWRSAGVIQRAKVELLAAGFLFETVKGYRPNKASWYALTWRKLNQLKGFDPGAEKAFERGAYRRAVPLLDVKKLRGQRSAEVRSRPEVQNTSLCPSNGQAAALIGLAGGQAATPSCLSNGPIRPAFPAAPCLAERHPLEKPSAAAAAQATR